MILLLTVKKAEAKVKSSQMILCVFNLIMSFYHSRNIENYERRKCAALQVKKDLDLGTELWNQKLLQISEQNIVKAEQKILTKREKQVEQIRNARKEKSDVFALNKMILQSAENENRDNKLRAINLKNKRVMTNNKNYSQLSINHIHELFRLTKFSVREITSTKGRN